MTRSFSWRPAPGEPPVTWTLEGTRLSGPAGDTDLTGITSAALVERRRRGSRIIRLDLLSGQARELSLAIATSASAAPDDPDRDAHWTLVQRIAAELARLRPGTTVALIGQGRGRRTLFAGGVIALLAGIILSVAALGGAGDSRIGLAAIPLGLLALFGLILGWANAPWRPSVSVPIEVLLPLDREAGR